MVYHRHVSNLSLSLSLSLSLTHTGKVSELSTWRDLNTRCRRERLLLTYTIPDPASILYHPHTLHIIIIQQYTLHTLTLPHQSHPTISSFHHHHSHTLPHQSHPSIHLSIPFRHCHLDTKLSHSHLSLSLPPLPPDLPSIYIYPSQHHLTIHPSISAPNRSTPFIPSPIPFHYPLPCPSFPFSTRSAKSRSAFPLIMIVAGVVLASVKVVWCGVGWDGALVRK